MSRSVVALDADVLVPIVACDFLLTTNDTRLREEIAAALPDLTPLSLDEFAQHLVREGPEEVSRVIDVLVAKRTRPAITRELLLISLRSIVPSIDWT